MGSDISLQLREQSLMTKIMLKDEDQIIEHIEEEKMEINRPVNQMGDTLMHYAAYKSLKKLLQYLLNHSGDPYLLNNRSLSPVDVALPEIREWMIRKHHTIQSEKEKQKKENRKQRGDMLQSKIIKENSVKE